MWRCTRSCCGELQLLYFMSGRQALCPVWLRAPGVLLPPLPMQDFRYCLHAERHVRAFIQWSTSFRLPTDLWQLQLQCHVQRLRIHRSCKEPFVLLCKWELPTGFFPGRAKCSTYWAILKFWQVHSNSLSKCCCDCRCIHSASDNHQP